MAEEKKRLTREDLRKLSPEERIKMLKALEEERKKELEKARQEAEEDIAEAEDIIKQTEEELQEELRNLDFKSPELEEIVAKEQPQNVEQVGGEYVSPFAKDGLYTQLRTAAEELSRLYGQNEWSKKDEHIYQESKRQVERAQTYNLKTEVLSDELGLANQFLNKIKYKK